MFRLYETAGADTAHHPIVQNLFGPLCEQSIAFIAGHLIEARPEVDELRARFVFVPVDESPVERRHAESHKRIKDTSNHSPPYLSLMALRRADFEANAVCHVYERTNFEKLELAVDSPNRVVQSLTFKPMRDAGRGVYMTIPHACRSYGLHV